jgi:6-phosphogluconolactonase
MEDIIKSTIKIFETGEGLSRNAAIDIALLLNEFIKIRGTSTIVLSGGETPKNIYQYLGSNFAEKVDWNKIYFFWGDERCVGPDDEDSNYRLAKINLLTKIPVPEKNKFRILGELEPHEASEDYERKLKKFFFGEKLPSFDIVLLGIGNDGHTASLFPKGKALKIEDRWVTEDYIEKLKSWRVTMTLPVFNNSKNILFIASGREKSNIINKILYDDNSNAPAKLIRPLSGRVFFYLDKAAAEA